LINMAILVHSEAESTKHDEKAQYGNESSSPTISNGIPESDKILHVAARDGAVPVGESASGYDPAIMGERTALNGEDEKKLLRRIDWHLIPLMAIIYCVKTIDASNVGDPHAYGQIVAYALPRFPMHESWIKALLEIS
jgi:hypothetical protein